MGKLTIPIPDNDIRALHVGDTLLLDGIIVTGRDAAHKFLVENFIRRPVSAKEADLYGELKRLLAGGVIYHCGPVVRQHEDGRYSFVAAGPTTSIREEPYQGPLMEQFGIRAVIGKGGMGPKTLSYCRKVGAVYLHAVGGAAQVLAERVVSVPGVHFAERFGAPEAIWEFVVDRFPVVVTMDSHGNSLHEQIQAASAARLKEILG